MAKSKAAAWYALIVLFAINTVNFFDRLVIGSVGEPIRKEFGLGDASLGLLATAFTLVYAIVGIPFGRLADVAPRKYVLSAGVFVWSLLTAGTGIAQTYWQMFAMRLGVGVGEASCAPAATSMIADLFPKQHRAKAMSIFMLGLPIGIGLSFAISGSVAQAYGWRTAFLVAGIPGMLLAVASLFLREPRRGGPEMGSAEVTIASGQGTYLRILSSPTMRWLILSGIIHNFCLYTLSSFMTPYMMRYHGLSVQDASFNSMLINGVFTLPGLLFGGVLGDRRRAFVLGGCDVCCGTALFDRDMFGCEWPLAFCGSDGRRICPNVLLLLECLRDHSGPCRARLTRNSDGGLFFRYVPAWRRTRAVSHWYAERLFHEAGSNCSRCDRDDPSFA